MFLAFFQNLVTVQSKMSNIDILERRLEELEAAIFGGTEKTSHRSSPDVIDAAYACSDAIKSATKGHARVKDTYANLPQLTSLLDAGVADKKIVTEDLQLGINMILADEERIRGISAQLQQIQTLNKNVLESEPIQNVPKLVERLDKLVEITIDQQGDAQLVTKETEELLTRYNDIANSLTRQFVSWDVIVTKLELAGQTKEEEFP